MNNQMLFLYIFDSELRGELAGFKSKSLDKLLNKVKELPDNLKWTIGNSPINYEEDQPFWVGVF